MEPKKSNSANLENRRFLFIETGFVISISLVLFAFNYSTAINRPIPFQYKENIGIIEYESDVEIIKDSEPKPVVGFLSINPALPQFGEEELPIEPMSINEIKDKPYKLIFIPLKDEERIIDFDKVELMPTFRGKHYSEFSRFISQHLKYPEDAMDNGIKGTVKVGFVIDKTGKLTQLKIIRSVHPSLDEEVLRVVLLSPQWEPGFQGDNAVSVRFVFPVTFK